MSQYSKSVDDVKVLAKKFQGIIELASALEEIGKVENAAKEAQSLKEKCEKDYESAKAKLESFNMELLAKQEEVKAAEFKVGDLLDLAHKKAQVIVEAAQEKSKQVDMMLEKRKALFDEKFISAGKELSALEAEAVVKKSELEALKKEVEEVKSKFSALLK